MGFGLERLGLMALSRPVVFSLLVVLITFVAGFHLSKVKFDGNVLAVIPENSQAFQNYEAQKHSFRNFSRDVAVILRSPDLFTADGLEEIRSLQLELSLEPDVSSVQTLFSVPNPDAATGELLPFFPDEFASDEDASRLIRQLLDENPQAASLVSEKHNAALVFVSMKTGLQETTDREAFEALKRLQSAVSDIAPEEVEIFYAGLTPIGLTILETLKRDQTRLTLIGLVVGALIAWCVFRSAIAAIICAVPPILTVIWSVGIFGFLEMPITYLTTVIPTLALILAYADGIVLFHRWTKNNEAFAPSAYAFHENLREAISRVGPAAALTSITTCIAFLSFLLNDSQPIRVFGMLGAASVLLGFVSVILALPLLTSAFLKIGYRPKSASKDRSGKFFGYVVRSFSAAPMGILIFAVIAIIGLGVIHFKLQPEYRVTDYLPKTSQTLEAEEIANDAFGGRSFVFVLVPTAGEGGMRLAENRERIQNVDELLSSGFPRSQVLSLDALLKRFTNPDALARVVELLEAAPDETRRRYISKDGDQMMVALRTPSHQSILETRAQLAEMKTILSELPYSEEIVITGFPVLLAQEFTALVEQMRQSLLIAIALAVAMIGIATRSIKLALVSAIPNLLPILLVEGMLFIRGGYINITEVVALTIAFGIAIDNAVHVINSFRAERNTGVSEREALRLAIQEVGPALASSTLIICAAVAVMLTSSLPTIPVIGGLIIIILVIALVSNLLVLPATILSLAPNRDNA